jgi:hypothetical protein
VGQVEWAGLQFRDCCPDRRQRCAEIVGHRPEECGALLFDVAQRIDAVGDQATDGEGDRREHNESHDVSAKRMCNVPTGGRTSVNSTVATAATNWAGRRPPITAVATTGTTSNRACAA